jgi:hypothetical protein
MGMIIRKSKNIRRHVKRAFREHAYKRPSVITFQFVEGDLVTPAKNAQGYDALTELPITLIAGDVCMVTELSGPSTLTRPRSFAHFNMIKVIYSGRMLYINPSLLRFLEDNE